MTFKPMKGSWRLSIACQGAREQESSGAKGSANARGSRTSMAACTQWTEARDDAAPTAEASIPSPSAKKATVGRKERPFCFCGDSGHLGAQLPKKQPAALKAVNESPGRPSGDGEDDVD